MRMSGLSGPPAGAAADVAPIASTSVLPTGPPSAGFAPPPAPGASAFDKKPKARVRKPRVSAPAAAGAGAGADETRPKRERKISVKIRDASTSNGGDSPPDEVAQSSSYKGKKRFTSYDEPSESDHDDGELDELASDYEEQLERKRRKLDASGGSGSDASSKKQRPRTKTPRDPAAEKAHRLALLAKEEAELAQDPKRFKVGQAVIARFPNYSYWPAMVLDPLTAPPKTQGTRVKGAYLVKSIPTGADQCGVSLSLSLSCLWSPIRFERNAVADFESSPRSPQSAAGSRRTTRPSCPSRRPNWTTSSSGGTSRRRRRAGRSGEASWSTPP